MGAGSAPLAMLWPEWPPPHMSTCWVSGWRAGWGPEEPMWDRGWENHLWRSTWGWGAGGLGMMGWRSEALGTLLSSLPDQPPLPPRLNSPSPGTSPHVVTNVSVVPLPKGANVSWEPGFDGGYLQRFSVWYTPL